MKPLQLQIIKLLSSNEVAEADLLEIKRLITKSLGEKIDEAVEDTFKKRKWGKKKIQEWGKLHQRSSYK